MNRTRTESEMYDLILGIAREEERVRGVLLNGSRTNDQALPDLFQDYDIVYLVNDLAYYKNNMEFIARLGEELIFQFPDEADYAVNGYYPEGSEGRFVGLLQFTDGNRIDLTIRSVSEWKDAVYSDKLCKVLLDKDGFLPDITPTDEDYHAKPPTKEQYSACCNEFYWVCTYVAKGLWRDEIPYAQRHLNLYVRDALDTMLAWRVGAENNYGVSVGKCGKYFSRYLTKEEYLRLLSTYSNGDTSAIWSSLEEAILLFYDTANFVARACQFDFRRDWHARVLEYCKKVRSLSKDADAIYC